ncbi:MAG: hypothetical protein JST80_00745 [Bdellovibrionales bacterium]|nr:hypothetical protein [Bdellovibrionales bacterium]
MREIAAHWALALPLFLNPSFAHADDFDTPARQECLSRVDALHSCACNDIRGQTPEDTGAFNVNRPDIKAAYLEFKNSTHYTADQDQKIVGALKAAFDEKRDELSCHDKVGVRIGAVVQAQDYCVHEEAAAYVLKKPLCTEVTQQQVAAASQVVTERISKFLGTFDQELDRMMYCRADWIHAKKNMRTIAVEYPPCKIDLKSLFPNNKSKLTAVQVAKILDHVKGHACYQQYVRNGLSLQKIEISSSSSLLANTGEAAKKSFLDLSKERADEIDNKIVAAVFDPSILNRVQFEKNFKGINGDGTSGACPYAYDSGRKNWIRKAFPTNEQLEPNKRTELNLYFGDGRKSIDSNIHSDMMSAPCKRVQFYCR